MEGTEEREQFVCTWYIATPLVANKILRMTELSAAKYFSNCFTSSKQLVNTAKANHTTLYHSKTSFIVRSEHFRLNVKCSNTFEPKYYLRSKHKNRFAFV